MVGHVVKETLDSQWRFQSAQFPELRGSKTERRASRRIRHFERIAQENVISLAGRHAHVTPVSRGFFRLAALSRQVIERRSARSTDIARHEETLAEGVGFEPTVGLTPRSISSRVP